MVHHEVFTASFLGWKSIKNGELLSRAANFGFDVLVTLDSGMEYKQNRETLPCSVVVLVAESNKIEDLRPLVPQFLSALRRLKPKTLIRIG